MLPIKLFTLILPFVLIISIINLAEAATTKKPKLEASSSPPLATGNLTFVLSGSQVPTKDTNSKVDGFVKVSIKPKEPSGKEVDLGQTEVIDYDDNPMWNKVFWTLWTKGARQKLRFLIKDHDTLGRAADIGEVILDLDNYVLEKNQDTSVLIGTSTAKDKTGAPSGGTGFLNIKKTTPISFRLYARNVPHKDPFNGKSDPFVEVYFRRGKNGANILLGKTAAIDDTESPDWNETFEFANHQKGTNQYWYFKVLDKDGVGSDLIGDLVMEVDPFAGERRPKILKLENSDGKVTLAVTPVN